MKNNLIITKGFSRVILFGFLILFLSTCEKPQRVIKLSTIQVADTDISYTSAVLRGEISDIGSDPVDDHGILVSENTAPIQSNSKYQPLGSMSSKGTFQYEYTNLTKNTTYYYRAVAYVNSLPNYGNTLTFKTKDTKVPTVITGSFSNLTISSAMLTAEVKDDGGAPVLKRGLCWSKTANPQIGSCLDSTLNGSGKGSFTGLIHGLEEGASYYVKAYAINGKGAGYSEDIPLTVLKKSNTITGTTSSITKTTATLNGSVNANNSSSTVVFYWGETTSYGHTPDASPKIVTGNTPTSVTAALTGLTPGTIYHYKVKASSAAGDSEGADSTFMTLELPVVTTNDTTNVYNTTATLNGTVNAKRSASAVTFEYGTTTSYGTSVSAVPVTVTGNVPVNVRADLTGLTPGTFYYFRVKAVSAAGPVDGNDKTFKTLLAPTATTVTATDTTAVSIKLNGIVNPNGSNTSVIFEYGTTAGYGSKISATQGVLSGSTATNVSAALLGLTPSTVYHYRVTASSRGGTTPGGDKTFETKAAPPTVSDIDGNIYNVIQIGTQTWMQQNLKTTKFSNGESLTLVEGAWTDASYPAYCSVNNNSSNNNPYGYLYNYYVAGDYRNACPTGWHVPDGNEWDLLINYLSGSSVAGSALKETGTDHWSSPNSDATNSSGFTAVPGGYRYYTWWNYVWGPFLYVGQWACYWESVYPNFRTMHNNIGGTGVYNTDYKSGLSIRCIKGGVPIVNILDPTKIDNTSCTLNAIVNTQGQSTDVIFEYGTDSGLSLVQPINADQSPVSGGNAVQVTASVSGLQSGTTYYFRVKATNADGTAYSKKGAFTTTSPVTDMDGNVYNTVQIGTQVWMSENLKTTKLTDGTLIQLVSDNGTWSAMTTSAYSYYNNDDNNRLIFGPLYNFYSVNTGKLCPSGWHVPTVDEWSTLVTKYGGNIVAGGALKETGLAHWLSPNGGATNESGFSGLPGGYRDPTGVFNVLGQNGIFWSSTSDGATAARYFYLNKWSGTTNIGSDPNSNGLSIRCVKD